MKIPISIIFVSLLVVAIWRSAAIAGATYSYWPAVVKLTGTLIFERHYGPPNYGETPDEDEKLTAPILVLDTPITVVATHNDPNEYETETGVTRLQIDMRGGSYQMSDFPHRRVTVEGQLSERRRVREVTRVLIYVDSLSKITEAK